jgi:DNA-binding response OmpR family regulator
MIQSVLPFIELEWPIMPHTILYIEDEPAIIELIQDVLAHPDIRLISVTNGTEGLAKVREVKPDLLLLDVVMPDRSGWSIYEEIRSDESLKQMPIILLTALLHRYRIMKEFSKSKIDAYITKPFDAGIVRQTVERMLGTVYWTKPGQESGRLEKPPRFEMQGIRPPATDSPSEPEQSAPILPQKSFTAESLSKKEESGKTKSRKRRKKTTNKGD